MAGEQVTSGDGGADASAINGAHASILTDRSIQFDHTDAIKIPKELPIWAKWLGKLFDALAPLIEFLFWAGVAILVAMLLYYIVTEIMGVRFFKPKVKVTPTDTFPEWKPDAQAARDLLAAADALAQNGRYDEAVHLILLRSIEDIDRHRPLVVRPALTARDIAAIPALPDRARPAFGQIARAVERTLFAGLSIDSQEFRSCRDAYATFALPDGWRV